MRDPSARTAPPTRAQALARVGEAFAVAGIPGAGPHLQVCLDVDGTIFPRQRTISRRVKQAIADHLAAGTHVVIATGRGRQAAQFILDMLPFDSTVLVCSNGAQTLFTGSTRIPGVPVREVSTPGVPDGTHHVANLHTFPQDVLVRAIEGVRRALPHSFLAVEPIDGLRRVSPGLTTGYLVEPPYLEEPDSGLALPDVMRMIVVDPVLDTPSMLSAIAAQHLTGALFAASGPSWLDVSPAGVTKASAVEQLRSQFGVAPTATVAVGDGGNDVAMLQWARLGIAMGSARNYVKDAADLVTATVEDDGAAIVLEALLQRA
ncbi:HAD family hydrolase [Neoactinobaculum massilliense]|uniref:HAD family hydrolase n=1 Tax=Neoactinobaculum massilliense TaxID=2364794 RepID=UPI000F5293CA|nr:HAD family hydrolase [Neoactinobaculum massilliense]